MQYRELRSVPGLLQQISWCAKSCHKQHLVQEHHFPFNVCKTVPKTNSKKQGILMDQDRGNT